MNINPQWIWIAAAAVAVLVIIGLIAAGARRSRTAALRDHFGREYDRTVEEAGSRSRAEHELVARAEEAKSFDIRPLAAAERDRYRDEWRKVEARFVERPTTAVVEADELITDVMRTRGYPIAEFEKHAALLSVKHPRVVEHYRAGHGIIDRETRSTEDLRQAVLHYRSLFEELVNDGGGVDVERPVRTVRERDIVRDEERPRG
ncbi:MAG TPA: hypothetical protein VJZ76_05575 [Thermoanaerobaculia bacterium]|nr:hypothetical protein [Thermoanaerobaculia bacterium]